MFSTRCLLSALLLISGCIVGEDPADPTVGTTSATWGVYDPKPGHPTLDERDAYVAEISRYAREAEATYGTPAAAITSMASNECGFGFTRIAINAHNLFGFKWTSPEAAGGRWYWELVGQPADDPNNKYILFADRRDAVLFVAKRLATSTRYRATTDRYQADLAAGVDVRTAADRWVRGIAAAGYNPYAHYPTTTINFMNNYRSPSATFSTTYNLYKYSPATASAAWISIDAPAASSTVSGDVAITSMVGGDVSHVRFATRATGAATWYSLGDDATAPFERTWATAPWVANGTYELKAEAWSGTTLRATGVIDVVVMNPLP